MVRGTTRTVVQAGLRDPELLFASFLFVRGLAVEPDVVFGRTCACARLGRSPPAAEHHQEAEETEAREEEDVVTVRTPVHLAKLRVSMEELARDPSAFVDPVTRDSFAESRFAAKGASMVGVASVPTGVPVYTALLADGVKQTTELVLVFNVSETTCVRVSFQA